MESRPKKLLDQVYDAIRVKHFARNTEQVYVYWIKKYIVRQRCRKRVFLKKLAAILFVIALLPTCWRPGMISARG